MTPLRSLALLTLFAGVVVADPPSLSKAAVPTFVVVTSVDPLQGVLRYTQQELVAKAEEIDVLATVGTETRVVKQKITVYRPTTREVEQKLDRLVFQTATGRVLPPEQAVPLLKKNPLVALAQDEHPLDPAFVRLLAADTLILARQRFNPDALHRPERP